MKTSLKLESGYTFDATISISELSTVIDTKSAPPSKADIVMQYRASLTIANTTSGHDWQMQGGSPLAADVKPFWQGDSLFCKAASDWKNFSTYCVDWGNALFSSGNIGYKAINNGSPLTVSFVTSARVRVDESKASDYFSAMSKPDGWVMAATWKGQSGASTCSFSSMPIVAATVAIPACKVQAS